MDVRSAADNTANTPSTRAVPPRCRTWYQAFRPVAAQHDPLAALIERNQRPAIRQDNRVDVVGEAAAVYRRNREYRRGQRCWIYRAATQPAQYLHRHLLIPAADTIACMRPSGSGSSFPAI
ncbi:MAG: hypothetical protein IPI73_30330 [Betaproteobacteria bacterium]|nr:hypothetical protein [Betaproteobacteria bacterium]